MSVNSYRISDSQTEKQELFDRVCRHLAAQKCQSIREIDGCCLYRGDKGRMCAIGCLIKDEDFEPVMNHLSVDHLGCGQTILEKVSTNRDVWPLLSGLQQAHDQNCDLQGLLDDLTAVARAENLNAESVAEITEWR